MKSQALPMIFHDFWSMEIDLLVPKNDQPSTCYPPRGPMRFRRTRSALSRLWFRRVHQDEPGRHQARKIQLFWWGNEWRPKADTVHKIIYNIIISIQNHGNLPCIRNIGIYQHRKGQTKTVPYGIKREKALSKPGSSAKSLCDSFFRFRRW